MNMTCSVIRVIASVNACNRHTVLKKLKNNMVSSGKEEDEDLFCFLLAPDRSARTTVVRPERRFHAER